VDYVETAANLITLTVAATLGDVIEFSIGEVFDVTLVRTGREEQSFTGLTSPTITLTTASYTPGAHEVDVFFNGALLATADYTETNSTTITLGFTPVASDQFRVIVGRAVNVTNVSRSQAGRALYPQTAAEIAAGVAPTDYAYEPGDVRRYGFTGDGSTDNTTAFQNALSANAGFTPVIVPNMGNYAKLTSRVTAPADTTIVLLDGAELRWTATTANGSTLLGSATRPGIEVTGDNFTIEGNGVLSGPASGVYVNGEIGIFAKGTSTSIRKDGFTIGGKIEIKNWGDTGWTCQFVNRINASGFHTHSCGQAGWFAFSCSHGKAHHFETGDITPGTGGNAYGFSLTHDSTGYSSDPYAASNGRLAANPFCIDFKVHHFTSYDIPLWVGADAHGGYECEIHDFSIYNCRHGAHMASGSGSALNYGGENCKIHSGTITTKKRDGTATSVAAVDRLGVVINGGATVAGRNAQVYGLTIDGYGDSSNTSASITTSFTNNASIRDITLTNWKGYGIYGSDGNGTVEGVTFDNPADATGTSCIRFDTTTGVWNSIGNKHRVQSGTVALEGLRIDSGNPRGLHMGNDFGSAATPYVAGGTVMLGQSDIQPSINLVDAGITSNAFSVAACGNAPHIRVYVALAGAQTVADITGVTVGQRISLHCNDGNLTFNRTNAALAGGANFTSTQFDVLELLCIATSGTKFVEIGRSANS
jgi:hypothetical protein